MSGLARRLAHLSASSAVMMTLLSLQHTGADSAEARHEGAACALERRARNDLLVAERLCSARVQSISSTMCRRISRLPSMWSICVASLTADLLSERPDDRVLSRNTRILYKNTQRIPRCAARPGRRWRRSWRQKIILQVLTTLCSENRRETAKRDRKRRTPKGGRRLAHHTPPERNPALHVCRTRKGVEPPQRMAHGPSTARPPSQRR